MTSTLRFITLLSACAVLLAGVLVNATDAVPGELDVFGKVVWASRKTGDITYHLGETLEVSSDFVSTTTWHDLELTLSDKSDNLLNLTGYSIIYSVEGILSKTTAPTSFRENGRALLPISGEGETKLSLLEEATGSTQEFLTVRVSPRRPNVKDIELGSREVAASANYTLGAVLEVPTYYKDKSGNSKIDLIFSDTAGDRINMNDYKLIFSEEGVLGASVTAAEWIPEGHAGLPILKTGKTDINLIQIASDTIQNVLTVVVYDWRN